MFRNMVTSLFKYERIRTTDAKAKEIRRWADKLVTLAKRGDLHARRQALSIIREKDVVHKLFTEAPERFAAVNGGYTRVVKVGFRPGDAAPISMVELVTPEVKKKKARRKKKSKKAETPNVTATTAGATEAAVTSEVASTADAASDVAPPAPETQDDAHNASAAGDEAGPAEIDAPTAASEGVATAAEETLDADTSVPADETDTEETPSKGS
jgi:large subunit ribosomal protein L17